MKVISWKEDKVVSIALKDGVHVLAQMGPSPYLIIFNLFQENDKWDGITLEQDTVLFCHAVTRQFLKMSVISEKKDIAPLKNISFPKYWISENASSRKVKIWENTPDEMEFFTLGKGGASLIENDITVAGFKETKVVEPSIEKDDKATIDKYETTSVSVYPEFNERLFLCSQYKMNIDPAKDLLFNRELPLSYKRYFQIVSGQVPLSELGY